MVGAGGSMRALRGAVRGVRGGAIPELGGRQGSSGRGLI